MKNSSWPVQRWADPLLPPSSDLTITSRWTAVVCLCLQPSAEDLHPCMCSSRSNAAGRPGRNWVGRVACLIVGLDLGKGQKYIPFCCLPEVNGLQSVAASSSVAWWAEAEDLLFAVKQQDEAVSMHRSPTRSNRKSLVVTHKNVNLSMPHFYLCVSLS